MTCDAFSVLSYLVLSCPTDLRACFPRAPACGSSTTPLAAVSTIRESPTRLRQYSKPPSQRFVMLGYVVRNPLLSRCSLTHGNFRTPCQSLVHDARCDLSRTVPIDSHSTSPISTCNCPRLLDWSHGTQQLLIPQLLNSYAKRPPDLLGGFHDRAPSPRSRWQTTWMVLGCILS